MRAMLAGWMVANLVGCGAGENVTDSSETATDADIDPVDSAAEIDSTAETDSAADEGDAEHDVETVAAWRPDGPITIADAPAVTFPLFAERTAALPAVAIPEGRAMVVDFDGDGRDDLVALGTQSGNRPVFLRNVTPPGGPIAFEDATAAAGLDGAMTLLVFGDLDNDGDADGFSGAGFRAGADGTQGFWMNDGRGHFTYAGDHGLAPRKASGLLYKEPAAATLADFDKDGALDLYVAMWNAGDLNGNLGWQTANALYKGDGHGDFAEFPLPEQANPLTAQMNPAEKNLPRRSYGLCPADFDDDGDLDLFVNNYGAGRPAADTPDPPHYWEWNFLWRNDGAMTFVDVGEASKVHATERGIEDIQAEAPVVMNGRTYPGPIGGNGFGCSWGDFDNDGDLDLVVGQIAHPDYPQTDRLLLHTNPGGAPGAARVFGEESHERGLEYYEDELHPVLVDIDLDGRLDLAVSRLRGGSKWEVYLQGEDQRFERESQADSGVDIVMPGPTVWLDADGDGDLDFFMPKDATGRLYENIAATGGSVTFELVAKAPRDATGARVTLTSGVGKQVREVIGGTGHYNSQQSRRLVFGLGGDSGASDVTIRWPDGEVQVLGDVRTGAQLRVEQGGAITLR